MPPKQLGWLLGHGNPAAGERCIFPRLPAFSVSSAGDWSEPWSIFIKTPEQKSIEVVVEGDATVWHLISLFEEIEGIPLFERTFIDNGIILVDDTATFAWTTNYLGYEATLNVFRNTRGNHMIWDIDSAKTFHLQVVNAAHFEELTGLIAPHTPIKFPSGNTCQVAFISSIFTTRHLPNAIYGNFDELKTLTELDYIS